MISVGGATEVAMKSTKDLVDDALKSTRAAAKDGYVAGGGVALLRTGDAIRAAQKKAKNDDEKLGFDIVLLACILAPIVLVPEGAPARQRARRLPTANRRGRCNSRGTDSST
jgi:chaperonin GroEL